MKKRILALLLAALMVLSLAACGEKPAEGVPPVLEIGGVKLTVPEEFRSLLTVTTLEDDPQGYLFTVNEKASVEAGKKLNTGDDGYNGWLFSIGKVSDATATEMRCGDHSGAQLFAKAEDGTHYVAYYPTDVTLVREDMNNLTEADQKQWSELNAWAGSAMREAFVAENGLTAEEDSNTDIDVALAQIAFQNRAYIVSTTEFGEIEANAADVKPYVEKLTNGVTFAYTDEQAPDGEYIVLRFQDDNMRLDFFKGNLVRRADMNSDFSVLFRATFADGTTDAHDVMQQWYNALVSQRDLDALGYKADDFVGTWAEKIAGRGTIAIEKGAEEGVYNVTIDWSSSAVEHSHWEMTAKADGGSVLRYEDCKHSIHTFKSETEEVVENKYENGTGAFRLNSAFEIMWQDDVDHAGDDIVFISAKE